MRDIARFGLPIAVLIAAAVTCFLIAFAPTLAPRNTRSKAQQRKR